MSSEERVESIAEPASGRAYGDLASATPRRGIKLLLNMGGAALARLGALLTTLIIVPISLSGLGPIYYGHLSTLLSASILLSYADLGLSLSIVNDIASFGDRRKLEEGISGIFSLLMLIFMGVAVLIVVGGGVAICTSSAATSTVRVCCVAFLMIAAGIPAGMAQRILYAQQRNILAGIWLVAGRVVTIVALLVCNMRSAEFEWYVYSIFGGPLGAAWLSMVYVVFRKYQNVGFSLSSGRLALKRMLEGLSYLALNLGGYFEIGIDNYLIGLFRGPAFVTNYDLLSRIYLYVSALTNVLAAPLWPSLRTAEENGDRRWARNITVTAMLLTVVATSSVSLIFAVMHAWIIHAWTGYQYRPDLPLALALASTNVLTSVTYVQSMVLNARGIVKAQALFTAVGAALLVLGKVTLLSSFSSLWVIPACTSTYYLFRILFGTILMRGRREDSLEKPA